MPDIPIILQPAEIALHREGRLAFLIRPSKAVRWCPVVVNGYGGWEDAHGRPQPCPLGQPGDVLVHKFRTMSDGHPTIPPPLAIRLTVDSVELIREESAVPAPGGDMGDLVVERWVWKVGVAQGEGS